MLRVVCVVVLFAVLRCLCYCCRCCYRAGCLLLCSFVAVCAVAFASVVGVWVLPVLCLLLSVVGVIAVVVVAARFVVCFVLVLPLLLL